MSPTTKNGVALEVLPGTDMEGRPVLVVVAKRTYALDVFEGTLTPLPDQPPVALRDEVFDDGDPAVSSLRWEAETAPGKPRCDVVFLGSAHAPGGEPVPTFDCSLRVGDHRHTLRIFGPRACTHVPGKGRKEESPAPRVSAPKPVAEVPLRWEYAYGGRSPLVLEGAAAEAASEDDHGPEVGATEPAEEPASHFTQASEGGTAVLDPSDIPTDEPTPPGDTDDELGAESTEWDVAAREAIESERAAKERAVAEDAAEAAAAGIPCPENPLGRGFALGNHPETIGGLRLPQIEDPGRLLKPADIPRDPASLADPAAGIRPAGFGWVGRGWRPRSQHAGVPPSDAEEAQRRLDEMVVGLDIDDPEQRATAEMLIDAEVPLMAPDFFQAAVPELQLEGLRGDEEVELANLLPTGTLLFHLPGEAPLVTLDRGHGTEPVEVQLDTLVIEADEPRVTMLWRGTLAVDSPEALAAFPTLVPDARMAELGEARAVAAARRRDRDGTAILDVSGVPEPAATAPAPKASSLDAEVDEDADDWVAAAKGTPEADEPVDLATAKARLRARLAAMREAEEHEKG